MAGQVNARLMPELDAEFDRWATELGIERGKLARDIITEALTARREGRAMFEQPEAPEPQDQTRIMAMLPELTTELDRLLRQNNKRDAELLKKARENTLGVSEARSAIVNDVVAQTRGSLEGVQGELAALRDHHVEALQRQPRLDTIDARLEGLGAKLDKIEQHAREPRTVTYHQYGDKVFTGRGQILVVSIIASAGALALFGVAKASAWSSLGVSILGGGDTAICRAIEHVHDAENCDVRRFGDNIVFKGLAPQRREPRR